MQVGGLERDSDLGPRTQAIPRPPPGEVAQEPSGTCVLGASLGPGRRQGGREENREACQAAPLRIF